MFCQKFKETVDILRVNETKVNSRNAFIESLFALKSAKQSKSDKKDLLSRLSMYS